MKCCICGKELKNPIIEGNNPWPVDDDPSHVCCSECNDKYVVPARVKQSYGKGAK